MDAGIKYVVMARENVCTEPEVGVACWRWTTFGVFNNMTEVQAACKAAKASGKWRDFEVFTTYTLKVPGVD